jgi:type II secretory pathway pseudopilin PulG
MIIVMVIIGILAVVLSEAYLTISRVALRVEQEKNLSEEALVLTQIFQAISDEATIYYSGYAGSLEGAK